MPPRLSEPLSPELVLVSPPEEAQRAREELPERPDSEWEDFLRRMRTRPLPAVAAEEPERVAAYAPLEPAPRRAGRRLVSITAVATAVAIAVGIAWARHSTGDDQSTAARHASAPAASTPAPTTTSSAKPKPARKPKHTATHAAATPKPKATSKPRVARKKKPKAASGKKSAPFVPARVWSWPAASGVKHYVVRFYRNDKKVLQIRAAGPRVVLPKSFSFRPGHYRWTVYAASGSGATGKPLVSSAFEVGGG